jgi:hypothetical protein
MPRWASGRSPVPSLSHASRSQGDHRKLRQRRPAGPRRAAGLPHRGERQLTYEGGSTKLLGVKITVRNRGGRDYVVSGREAQAGENQKELQLTAVLS